jgi:hypothetical protein
VKQDMRVALENMDSMRKRVRAAYLKAEGF